MEVEVEVVAVVVVEATGTSFPFPLSFEDEEVMGFGAEETLGGAEEAGKDPLMLISDGAG